MNIEETIKLLSALQLAGVKHFKSPEFEIHLDGNKSVRPLVTPTPDFRVHLHEQEPVEEPVTDSKYYNPQATKKVEDLIQDLKLDDSQILNKIFPAGAED